MKTFMSYSSKDTVYVEKLDSELLKFGANIFRDKRELLPLHNIKKFMTDISKMDYAITLISKNYLKSEPCVYEFTEYLKKENASQTIIPIIVSDFNFSNSNRQEILDHIDKENLTKFKTKSWIKATLEKIIGNKQNVNDWNERFDITWDFLKNTKLFNYKESENINFSDILSFLKIYEKDITDSLQKIVKIKDTEEQDIQYEKLLKQHPGNFWIIRYRAYLCTEKKQYKKAIYFFEEFLSKFSDPLDKITTFYDLGVCYYQLKDYENALKSHKEAINIHPYAHLSYRGLADVYMVQEKYDLAYSNYEFTNNFEKNCLVLNNMATILEYKGNSSKAIELYKEAIKLDTQEPTSYINLAAVYKKKRDFLKYDEILEISLQLFPNHYLIITNYVANNFCNERGDPLTMLNLLKKSFHINPDYIDTRLFLAHLLFLHYSREIYPHKELIFAKKILLKTLKMKITKEAKDYALSILKVLSLLEKKD